MLPTENLAHVTEAISLLTDVFRGGDVNKALLSSYIKEIQALEAAAFDVIEGRQLPTAENAQLDSIGDLVGEPRLGRDDDTYRAAIKVRIRINRSQGKAEDVIDVVRLIVGAGLFDYTEVYPAGFYVTVYNTDFGRVIQDAISKTRAAATRGVLLSSPSEVENVLIWDSEEGGTDNGNVWNSSHGGGLTTVWASAQEAVHRD
jgi:hypothetical protein